MAFPTYTPQRRYEMAALLDCNEQYLYQIMKGLKVPAPLFARRWNKLDPEVKLQDLLPNDWQAIWPELATAKAA